MYDFEKCIGLRMEEGFSSTAAPTAAAFSWDDVTDYLEHQPEISR
jgi:hypothetical protein